MKESQTSGFLLEDQHQEDKVLGHTALRTSGAYIQESWKAVGN